MEVMFKFDSPDKWLKQTSYVSSFTFCTTPAYYGSFQRSVFSP